MPKELPGFYYDAEKNRYFPCKGPIPGSHTKPPIPPPPAAKVAYSSCEGIRMMQEQLLHARELGGNVISSRRGKLGFQAECQKRLAAKPVVLKCKETRRTANVALQHVVADVTSMHGLLEREILLSGGMNGLVSLFQVGKAQQEINSDQIYKLDPVWPPNVDQTYCLEGISLLLGSSYGAVTRMSSEVSCIKVSGKNSASTDDRTPKHFVITTLGSDRAPGSVWILDLSKPLAFDGLAPIAVGGFSELAAFKQTIWTADCGNEGRQIAIGQTHLRTLPTGFICRMFPELTFIHQGTNRGVALLDMETGASSWILRCKSDVLSVQFDLSGKSIICGLRNGAIMSLDSRRKLVSKSMHCFSTTALPSSVCCLSSLKLWDQYFLASSMDGSIKLYDHRLIRRGSVQSYEGNVNSHTRIDLGVDPSEKVVLSGGEDCYMSLWDIKSGKLLFKDRFMNSVPSAVCWPRSRGLLKSSKEGEDYRCYWQDSHWDAAASRCNIFRHAFWMRSLLMSLSPQHSKAASVENKIMMGCG